VLHVADTYGFKLKPKHNIVYFITVRWITLGVEKITGMRDEHTCTQTPTHTKLHITHSNTYLHTFSWQKAQSSMQDGL